MKYNQFIIIVGILLYAFLAQSQAIYKQLIIHDIEREQIVKLSQLGVIIDSVDKDNTIAYIRPEDMDILEKMAINYTVIPQHHRQRQPDGYPTFDQISKIMQSFEQNYPHICQMHDIGKSYEGRSLLFMKISDHVMIEEDEPEVKYISSMHGDEPIGTILSLNLIDHLLSNYDKDAEITELVNELEIWIMPLMNPDGYVHNKRFNMQGFDLNRNFPDRVVDSQNTTTGRAIEIQHVMNWAFEHSSVLSANFHSGELVVNYPYDSDFDSHASYSATPDDKLFREMALSYAQLNSPMYNSTHFPFGITNGVDWYFVYGGMQDWNYVWMGCMELTIELYSAKDGPSYSIVPDVWNDNRDAMIRHISWSLAGIRGLITDVLTGEPVFASVKVKGNDFCVYTDPDVGDYHRILLPGFYDLIFSAKGYATMHRQNIAVTDSDAKRVDIQMIPISLQMVLEILQGLSNCSTSNSILRFDVTGDDQLDLRDVLYVMHFISLESVTKN